MAAMRRRVASGRAGRIQYTRRARVPDRSLTRFSAVPRSGMPSLTPRLMRTVSASTDIMWLAAYRAEVMPTLVSEKHAGRKAATPAARLSPRMAQATDTSGPARDGERTAEQLTQAGPPIVVQEPS